MQILAQTHNFVGSTFQVPPLTITLSKDKVTKSFEKLEKLEQKPQSEYAVVRMSSDSQEIRGSLTNDENLSNTLSTIKKVG